MNYIRSIIIIFICCLTVGLDNIVYGANLNDTNVAINGKIVDARNNKGIGSVDISLMGSNIGTISNSDGYFSLTCPTVSVGKVSFSIKGYSTVTVPLDSLRKGGNIIRLDRQAVELSEVVVYGGDPVKIVEEAIKKIPANYSLSNDLLSVFYRETIKKGRRFVGVSEAAIDVYKTPYNKREIAGDRVQIERGRRLVSQKSNDTIAVKIVGGPNLAVCVDFVKNADALFSENELSDYEFKMKNPELIDDRLQYVIDFRPKVQREYAQFRGSLYIDRGLLAFTRAEFEIDPSDKAKMTAAVLHKKPRGLRFNPQKIDFVVSYKQVNGKTYLNYIQNVMRFKCDMKRRLFSSAYTAYTEMVVVNREEGTEARITRKDAFKPRQIFYDLVDQYWDEDYWSDYNIIEPTESLEHAVEKLKKTGKTLSMQ